MFNSQPKAYAIPIASNVADTTRLHMELGDMAPGDMAPDHTQTRCLRRSTKLNLPAWNALLLQRLFQAVVAIGLCALIGYFKLFTTWAPYDDEGYVLVTLQHYALGFKL